LSKKYYERPNVGAENLQPLLSYDLWTFWTAPTQYTQRYYFMDFSKN